MSNKKPLHSYEQSMLLSALLFDPNNINDILSFIPDEQREKMSNAKNKFLNLPKNERLTQIVLELRRLLLIDTNYSIHQSWIDDALALEPLYLRKLVSSSLIERSIKSSHNKKQIIPTSFIVSSFFSQFIKNPQKRAIFDPVLMRLQSLRNEPQSDFFSVIGNLSINALASTLDGYRLVKYLSRKNFLIKSVLIDSNINPFKNEATRGFYLKQLIKFCQGSVINGMTFAGLLVTALYLSVFKYQWRRTIVLVLEKRIGLILEEIIDQAKSLNIDRNQHALLSSFLLYSFEQARI